MYRVTWDKQLRDEAKVGMCILGHEKQTAVHQLYDQTIISQEVIRLMSHLRIVRHRFEVEKHSLYLFDGQLSPLELS